MNDKKERTGIFCFLGARGMPGLCTRPGDPFSYPKALGDQRVTTPTPFDPDDFVNPNEEIAIPSRGKDKPEDPT